MKTARFWLDEYQKSHRHPLNKKLHWLCVPPIVLAVIGLLRAIPVGNELFNAASLGLLLAVAYYLALSWRLGLGMAVVLLAAYLLMDASWRRLGALHLPLTFAVFVLAWVGQFIGHKYEGAKPSFLSGPFYLLIGPLWLLADAYKRLNLRV